MKRPLMVFALACIVVLAGAALADKRTRASGADSISVCILKTPTPDGGGTFAWNACGHVPYEDGGWVPATCHSGDYFGTEGKKLLLEGLQLWKSKEKP